MDINVSPDKRTIFLHAEQNLLEALKAALEERFAPSRSTFNVNGTQTPAPSLFLTQGTLPFTPSQTPLATPVSAQRPTAGPDAIGNSSLGRRMKTQPYVLSDDGAETPASSHISQSRSQTMEDEGGNSETSFGAAPLLSDTASDEGSSLPHASLGDTPTGSATPSMIASSPAPTANTPAIVCRNYGRSFTTRSSPSLLSSSSEASRRRTASSSSSSMNMGQRTRAEPLFSRGSEDEDEPEDEKMAKSNSPEIVLSTQGASWARQMSLSPETEDREAERHLHQASITSENLDDEDVVLPLQSSTTASSASKRPLAPSSPGKERELKRTKREDQSAGSKKDLRSRLASFAAPGSQLPSQSDSSDADELSERDLQDEEEADGLLGEEVQLSDRRSSRTFKDTRLPNVSPLELDLTQASERAPHAADEDVDVLSVLPSKDPDIELVRMDVTVSTLPFDLQRVQSRWSRLASTPAIDHLSIPSATRAEIQAASITSSSTDADTALSRMITKDDFTKMKILGQFNLGFIITSLDQDLWIVDQHAADEKYNFEDLQKNTKIQSQKLVRPRPLELSAADELVAREHVDVLRQNGFEVDIGDEEVGGSAMDDDIEEPRPRGLRLVAQPVSKNTVFDMHGQSLYIQS